MTTMSKPVLPVTTTDAPGAPAEALDTTWPARESAAKGDNDGAAPPSEPSTERHAPGHIDSALESLGEAISDPVREAAEEGPHETAWRPSPVAPTLHPGKLP